jgi:hypothetical protein
MIKFFNNLLNFKTMRKTKTTNRHNGHSRTKDMKVCSISGRKFTADASNFYMNRNTADGLHPYHKTFDNIRRTQDVTTQQLRSIVNLINKA